MFYRVKDWGDVAKSQETPEDTWSWKKTGKILLWRLQRLCGPIDTLISNIYTPELEENKFLLFYVT